MLKRLTVLLSALIFVAALGGRANATGIDLDFGTSLYNLIKNNGYITEGDKRFSDFTFTLWSSNLSKTSPDNAGGINVAGVTLGGNHGLAFFPSSFDSLFYASQGATLKIVIGYKVTVTDPNLEISDIHLAMGSLTEGNATITVTEKAYEDSAHTILLGQATVTNPPEYFDAEMVDLDHTVPMAWVTKEILINGGSGCEMNPHHGGGGYTCKSSGKIAFIKQLVSQERPPQDIPEPSTFFLLGSGLVGLITRFRKGGAERT